MRVRTISKLLAGNCRAWANRLLGGRPRPYKVLLEVTSRCNSRCLNCGVWRRAEAEQSDFSLAAAESLFRDLGSDLRWLSFSGGEPTLYASYRELLSLAKSLCPNLVLIAFTTNGLRPDAALELGKLIREFGYDLFVTVSLDGDRELHDRLRGRAGNHDSAWRTYSLLRAQGIPAHFGITLSASNQPFVLKQYDTFRKSLKAISIVHSGGIYGQDNSAGARDDLLLEALTTISRRYRIRSVGDLLEWAYVVLGAAFLRSGRKKIPVRCEVIHGNVHVRTDGSIHPCMFLPALGNVSMHGVDGMRRALESRSSVVALERIKVEQCPRCWMNCYAPHSILLHPVAAFFQLIQEAGRQLFSG